MARPSLIAMGGPQGQGDSLWPWRATGAAHDNHGVKQAWASADGS
jgi:hypothetical protein